MVLFAKVVLSTLALLPFFCFYRKTFRTTLLIDVFIRTGRSGSIVLLYSQKAAYFLSVPIQVHLCQIRSKGPCLYLDSHHLQNHTCSRNVKTPINKLTAYPQ